MASSLSHAKRVFIRASTACFFSTSPLQIRALSRASTPGFCSSTTSQLKHLKLGVPSQNPIHATTRRLFCSGSRAIVQYLSEMKELDPILSEMEALCFDVIHSIVALKTYFSDNAEFEHSATGIFVDPTMIVTSAHAVGLVTPGHCHIGRTVAVTRRGMVLPTRLLAVNFGGDVAVLQAQAEGEWDIPPPCPVGNDIAAKELPLLVLTQHEGCNGYGLVQIMTGPALGDDSFRPAWAYPLSDGFGWVRYGRGPIDGLTVNPGSPWFSLHRQVVDIASSAAGEEHVWSVGGYVVPPPRIRSAVDYAKGKGSRDPVVMDRWITDYTVADYDHADAAIAKECLRFVPGSYVVAIYLPRVMLDMTSM